IEDVVIPAERGMARAVRFRRADLLVRALFLTRLVRGERLRVALGGLSAAEVCDVVARRQRLRSAELLSDALTLHDEPLNHRPSDMVVPLQCDIRHGPDLL